jgi:hypothetical protein
VLQALQLLTRVVNEGAEAVLHGESNPGDLHHRGSDVAILVEEEGTEEGRAWKLSMEIPVTMRDEGSGQQLPPVLGWTYDDVGDRRPNIRRPFREIWQNIPLPQAIGPAVLYRFDARRIADAAPSTEVNPAVEEDGGNTAAVLAALKLDREEVFTQIEEELRKVVPNVQRIRIRQVKVTHYAGFSDPPIGYKVFIDFKGASDIPAHGASEGTLITLALLSALCSPNRPRVLLLDDIDQALHPQAQMELMRELKRLLENFPAVQIVATTHSPYILDELTPEDIRVFALRQDGSVACRSLSDHPQAEKMRGALTSGQLWSLDPEWRWVSGEG